jgi:hypothetical protein
MFILAGKNGVELSLVEPDSQGFDLLKAYRA